MEAVNPPFLQRKWIIESLPLMLREAVYHRAHHDMESTPGVELWKFDEPLGEAKVG